MANKQEKEYRLANDRSGESFILKVGRNGKLTVYDEEFVTPQGTKGARRAIRHCPNQQSIFLDKQDKFAKVEPIIFINGYLKVPADQPMTQMFLDMHPSNVANGGRTFEPVDEAIEAQESIEVEELQTKLKAAVISMSEEKQGLLKLSSVAAVIEGSVDKVSRMQIPELKRIIYNKIEDNPYYFTDDGGNITIFEDESVDRKYVVLTALKHGVLRKSANGRSMLWGDNKELIVTAPIGVDFNDYFANYLTTDDGVLVFDEIIKRI